ncbi:MAG TPA: NADH-quinone oxidoreductase subunit NuoK [Verrucomicrobiota bacterium]|nr:NADH-quinone oxidoreductase subunit NuoK [Verrucomicrobiota bacterium]
MTIGLSHYLTVSIILFCLGVLGLLTRRNLIVVYMSLELMLNATNLALVAFSYFNKNLDGQIMVMLVVTVAAAEVAVGLALIISLARKKLPVWINDLNKLKY